jgi:outer membrane protein
MHFPFRQFPLALICVVASASGVAAQQVAPPPGVLALSLGDALRLAERESEALRIARAGVDRARGQTQQARSLRLPQVSGSASYQRAIQSQFEEISKRVGSGGGSDTASGGDGGNGFADSPLARVFASANTVVLGLNASQTIYSGGRIRAGIAAAEAGQRAATLGERAARAQFVYDVAQAYYDALVAEQLLAIADSSAAQTERAFEQTQVAREVGNAAEFDLIRARVQRDNLRPTVIAARARRDIAHLHLRQLLNLPADRPLMLTTALDANTSAVADAAGVAAPSTLRGDTSVASRAAVLQAHEAVRAQEQQLAAVRGQRFPQMALTSNYQRFSYPSSVFEDRWKMYFPNWTVSFGLSLPLFTGGRQDGEQAVARANLAEARERYAQAVEAAALDSRLAYAQLQQAEAVFAASAGTDEQAARGYAIAEVRFAEGLATQLELAQTRVDLETARANRAQAARDLALARLRVSLLQNLPLAAGLGGGGQ